jgi:hypothetical protein
MLCRVEYKVFPPLAHNMYLFMVCEIHVRVRHT